MIDSRISTSIWCSMSFNDMNFKSGVISNYYLKGKFRILVFEAWLLAREKSGQSGCSIATSVQLPLLGNVVTDFGKNAMGKSYTL